MVMFGIPSSCILLVFLVVPYDFGGKVVVFRYVLVAELWLGWDS